MSGLGQEIALRAGREAARSAEEWGLPRHRAWAAGALVAVRALGREAAAAGKPIDSIVLEACEVARFIGNAGSSQEPVKQAARGLGRYLLQQELELGKPSLDAVAQAARFTAAAAKSARMPRQRAARLACSLAAAAMREDLSMEESTVIQDASCKAGQEAGLNPHEALELSCIEAGVAAGQLSLSSGSSVSDAASEAGASAVTLGSGKGLPSSKHGRVAAKAAARCAAEAPGPSDAS